MLHKKRNCKGLPFEFTTISELMIRAKERYAETTAVTVCTRNINREYTYSELYAHVMQFCGLLRLNQIAKCKVALIGGNGYEWLVAFLSICASGNTAVLIDADAPEEEWTRCARNCPVQWAICDGGREERAKKVFSENVISLSTNLMEELENAGVRKQEAFCPDVTPQSEAAVIFTSGTSGASKGVLLSHHNLCSDMKASLLLAGVDEKDDILAVLPPHHAFQLVTGLLTPLFAGMCIYFGRGLKYLKKDLAACKPSVLVLVPVIVRSLEKQIQCGIQREGKDQEVRKAMRLSNFMLKCGIDLRKRFFSEIQSLLGGRLRCIICGGAALENDVVKRMISYGLPVMTGYGITECSPVVSCNQLGSYKVGAVGRATPYGEVKIIDHEIAVRGDIVARGYYNMPEETASSFRNGWFFTGDLGTIDRKGFITITGRKKNLIVLSNGKNVSPEEIEDCIRSIDGVKEVIVKGDKKEVQPDYLIATIWVDESNCLDFEACRHLYQQRIEEMNHSLPAYKRIQNFEICEEPINYTRTGKVKREEALPAAVS